MLALIIEGKPLLVGSLLEQAERVHSEQPVVSGFSNGGLFTTVTRSWRVVHGNWPMPCWRLESNRASGGSAGRNTHLHLELYYASTGIGAVCHTLNPCLHPEQLTYIIEHAEDTLLFFDIELSPLVAKNSTMRAGVMCCVALDAVTEGA